MNSSSPGIAKARELLSRSSLKGRSEEHTSELQSHSELYSFPTRRSSDLFTFVYRQRLRAGWKKVKTSESAAMSGAQESLSASRVVKAFGQEERENEQFFSRYSESARAALKVFVEGEIGRAHV